MQIYIFLHFFSQNIWPYQKKAVPLEDIPNGYIVKDDIEYGHDTVLPLWHFGLTY